MIRLLAKLIFVLAGLAWATAIQAQPYPSRPVKIVVGFAAGGSTDKLARIVAQRLSEELGQSVVVENRPGAAGNIAAEAVAGAAPDGYTLFMATLSSQAINPHLYQKLNFDPIKSFEPVMLVAQYPLLLVVPPQLGVATVVDLVAYARANPGRVFYASSGNGSPAHLAGEIFKNLTGTDVRHVPYRGGGPAMLSLMSGETQFGFETIPSAIGHARSGKLRGIGVTSETRSTAAPDLPTMKEAGIDHFVVTSWAGLVAPAGTPRDVINRLTAATQATIAAATVQTALAADGAQPGSGDGAAFGRFMQSELKSWGEVVQRADAKVE